MPNLHPRVFLATCQNQEGVLSAPNLCEYFTLIRHIKYHVTPVAAWCKWCEAKHSTYAFRAPNKAAPVAIGASGVPLGELMAWRVVPPATPDVAAISYSFKDS